MEELCFIKKLLFRKKFSTNRFKVIHCECLDNTFHIFILTVFFFSLFCFNKVTEPLNLNEKVPISGILDKLIEDILILRLISFPNVLITSHQAFLTFEALTEISKTVYENIDAFENQEHLKNEVIQ